MTDEMKFEAGASSENRIVFTTKKIETLKKLVSSKQCDQIWKFIELWATVQSVWQQLICPNLSHS